MTEASLVGLFHGFSISRLFSYIRCVVIVRIPLISQSEARCPMVPRRVQGSAGGKGPCNLRNCTMAPNVNSQPYLLSHLSALWLALTVVKLWPGPTTASCLTVLVCLYKQNFSLLKPTVLSALSLIHYHAILTFAFTWAHGFHRWDTFILLYGEWSSMHSLKYISSS